MSKVKELTDYLNYIGVKTNVSAVSHALVASGPYSLKLQAEVFDKRVRSLFMQHDQNWEIKYYVLHNGVGEVMVLGTSDAELDKRIEHYNCRIIGLANQALAEAKANMRTRRQTFNAKMEELGVSQEGFADIAEVFYMFGFRVYKKLRDETNQVYDTLGKSPYFGSIRTPSDFFDGVRIGSGQKKVSIKFPVEETYANRKIRVEQVRQALNELIPVRMDYKARPYDAMERFLTALNGGISGKAFTENEIFDILKHQGTDAFRFNIITEGTPDPVFARSYYAGVAKSLVCEFTDRNSYSEDQLRKSMSEKANRLSHLASDVAKYIHFRGFSPSEERDFEEQCKKCGATGVGNHQTLTYLFTEYGMSAIYKLREAVLLSGNWKNVIEEVEEMGYTITLSIPDKGKSGIGDKLKFKLPDGVPNTLQMNLGYLLELENLAEKLLGMKEI